MAVIDNLNAVRTPNTDDVNVTGTVDGAEYTVHVWLSHLQWLIANTAGTPAQKKAAVRQYVAQQLKAVADAAAPPAPPAGIDLTGTPITV